MAGSPELVGDAPATGATGCTDDGEEWPLGVLCLDSCGSVPGVFGRDRCHMETGLSWHLVVCFVEFVADPTDCGVDRWGQRARIQFAGCHGLLHSCVRHCHLVCQGTECVWRWRLSSGRAGVAGWLEGKVCDKKNRGQPVDVSIGRCGDRWGLVLSQLREPGGHWARSILGGGWWSCSGWVRGGAADSSLTYLISHPSHPHSQSLNFTHSLTHTDSLTPSLTFTYSHSLASSLPHSAMTHSLTPSLTHILTHSLTYTHTHSPTLTHSLTHSLSLALSHSLSLHYSLTHILTHSLSHFSLSLEKLVTCGFIRS